MISEMKMKKAFTLIELMVAIALLAMVLSFSGLIFKVSINSHRTSNANTDIMQKLRAVTDQLNTDFRKLPPDAYLVLHCEEQSRNEYDDSADAVDFRADRMYYFCTGDFQSWYDESVKASIARVYFGHDGNSVDSSLDRPVSWWNLSRDIVLLGIPTPIPPLLPLPDCNSISYAACVANPSLILSDSDSLLSDPPEINIQKDANNVRRLMCENVGELLIEWSDGTKYPDETEYPAVSPNLENSLVWFSGSMPKKDGNPLNGIIGVPAFDGTVEFEAVGPPAFYRAIWTPLTPKQYWPKALKFTFTLYDSKGILEKGRTFTHIVYLEN